LSHNAKFAAANSRRSFNLYATFINLFIDTMEEQEPDSLSYHQRKILISALALTAICTQLTTIMSAAVTGNELTDEKARCHWNDTETTHLVDYLWQHRAQAGDGGNFKTATFHAAAQHIAEFRTLGPVKTVKHLQSKWSTVSCSRSIMINQC
jgi:hypothetical protein